ncbi:2-amino-4-hydroxy-6-hydroxymethyldihydropteridine diphosphokinase [Candidatus Peribacteria bacterium]|nr:2-amino-4-hydroxy-6-hydroxymethyldihydropteridine diphosphokinase [Candidatus Peribacteria bacterium]MBM3299574.1 2-amino-4-hydroxy-6-hydroxymethyldihydropteridine diphosphokinase [Deltaproteobacteria bacterium]
MVPNQHIYIGLGSNIHPENHLRKAASMLRSHFPAIQYSSVYRSSAREVEDQDDFLNAVAHATTEKSPGEIHTILQAIESSLGKAPPYRFGPRTIDLDLLLCGDMVIPHKDGCQLVVPHPRMHERRFVLGPLCELIDPQTLHPLLGVSWESLLEKTLDQHCALTPITL